MRTIKITITPEPRAGMTMELSTEVIVDDDEATIEEAGQVAQATLFAFMRGFAGDEDDGS